MKRIFYALPMALALLAPGSYAKTKTPHYDNLICVGQETDKHGGKVWQLKLDFHRKKFIFGGQVFKIDSIQERNKNIVVYSEDFINTDNIRSYNAFIMDDESRMYLFQYSVKPEKMIAGIDLICHTERTK